MSSQLDAAFFPSLTPVLASRLTSNSNAVVAFDVCAGEMSANRIFQVMGLERHRKSAALKGCPERRRRSLSKHISTATAPGVYPNRIVKMLPSSRRRRAHHPELCRRALRAVRGAFRALGLLCPHPAPRRKRCATPAQRHTPTRDADLCDCPFFPRWLLYLEPW